MALLGDFAKELAHTPKLLVDDEVVQRMLPGMQEAAKKLADAAKKGRSVLVRFHCDADGITSGVALYNALRGARMSIVQNNSAVYEVKEAVRDLSGVLGQQNALFVLADFGANEESAEALSLLKAAGIEILVIDHHPPAQKTVALLSHFVSPHKEGMQGTSDYTAGFLCAHIAKIAGANEEFMDELAGISLIGDKSKFAPANEELVKKALVLDYLSSFGNFPNAGEFYTKMLLKKELWMEFYTKAQEKIDEIRKQAAAVCKVSAENGVGIVVVPLEKLAPYSEKYEFPSKGKVCGIAFEALRENGKAFVGIGHSKKTVNFRASREATAKGFSARKIIGELKVELPNCIEAGGGHDAAASMKIREECEGIVLEAALKKTKEWAAGAKN